MANEIDTIKFICPDCGHTRLECCFNGPHKCKILSIDGEGDFEYGDYESSTEPDRFQCINCGFVLVDKSGTTIWDNTEIAGWCKENCEQE